MFLTKFWALTLLLACFLWESNALPAKILQKDVDAGSVSGTLNVNEKGSPWKYHVSFETAQRLRVRLYAEGMWEIPESVSPLPTPDVQPPEDPFYRVEVPGENDDFQVKVMRSIDGSRPILELGRFEPGDSFNNVVISINATKAEGVYLYGLGERLDSFRLPTNTTYEFWNKDTPNEDHKNLYGSHPVFLRMEHGTKDAHMVHFRNTRELFVDVETLPNLNVTNLHYNTNGYIDFFIVLSDPQATHPVRDVVQQFSDVVGKPFLPPLWSLGFHQCRWGYNTTAETKAVVEGYTTAGLPLDTIWNDIDYMEDYHDFTLDPTRYKPEEMKDFHNWLAGQNKHHVYIVDPGIPAIVNSTEDGNKTPFQNGVEKGVFYRDWKDTTYPIMSRVWPEELAAFPDFMYGPTTEWWKSEIQRFYELGGEASGMWIDMNEPASFCHGHSPIKCKSAIGPFHPKVNLTSAKGSWNMTKVPDATVQAFPANVNTSYWDEKTISVEAVSVEGHRMINTHNLYGHTEMIATHKALSELSDKRPFVLSRSTFPGSGHYGAHWTGDNYSTSKSMKQSVSQLLTLGLSGFSMVGSDICGFFGDTTETLCARWMAMGAFYPFSRNHNMYDTISQEPYALGDVVLSVSKHYLTLRYTLLPYLYTQFVIAHETGLPVMRPMMMEFSEYIETWGIDSQFMVGPSLLIAPCFDADNADAKVDAFVPYGRWYRWYSDRFELVENDDENKDATRELSCKISKDEKGEGMPVLIREGAVLGLHPPHLTTEETRSTKQLDLLIVANSKVSSRAAADYVVIDDGKLQNRNTNGEVKISITGQLVPDPAHLGSDIHKARVQLNMLYNGTSKSTLVDDWKVGHVRALGFELKTEAITTNCTLSRVKGTDSSRVSIPCSYKPEPLSMIEFTVPANYAKLDTDLIIVETPFFGDVAGGDPDGADPNGGVNFRVVMLGAALILLCVCGFTFYNRKRDSLQSSSAELLEDMEEEFAMNRLTDDDL